MAYQPANTDWFARCGFGIAAHWTAQSVPVSGPPLPFARAVADFDVEGFLTGIRDCGANYVLFTATHALQKLPGPSKMIDRISADRTCRRDLLGELADGCARRNLKFMVYYNHSCNHGDDPAWEQAVGYHGPDKQAFAANIMSIVGEMGERYGERLAAWWFDSGYSLDPSGPHNSVSTDLRGFRFPWESLAASAKHGHAQRLITFNAGLPPGWMFKYSEHQDYLAGEVNELCEPPEGRWAPNGLQNHRWVCLDNPGWVHGRVETPLMRPRYSVEEVAAYLRTARRAQTPVTFNVDVAQSGELSAESLRLCAAAARKAYTR